MSERERWIVYPLLFLTLGIALRDKLGGATKIEAQRIECERLVVKNEKAGAQVVIDSTKAGGIVHAISADHTMDLVLGHEDHGSSLFCETAAKDHRATWALLGDLQRAAPKRMLDWLSEWPLLDPRLDRAAKSGDSGK